MREIEINFNSIRSKKQFFSIMNEKFFLPTYFAFSFDSLDECMRDLSWIVEKEIIVTIKYLDRVKGRDSSLYKNIKESFELYEEHWNNNGIDKKLTFKVNNDFI